MDAKTPRKFALRTSSINSSVKSSKLAAGTGFVKPAEFTKISHRPNLLSTSLAASIKVFESVIDAFRQKCLPAGNCFNCSLPLSRALRPINTQVAPNLASRCAVAKPTAPLPPIMTATLLFKSSTD